MGSDIMIGTRHTDKHWRITLHADADDVVRIWDAVQRLWQYDDVRVLVEFEQHLYVRFAEPMHADEIRALLPGQVKGLGAVNAYALVDWKNVGGKAYTKEGEKLRPKYVRYTPTRW